jgi:hypothetical protein
MPVVPLAPVELVSPVVPLAPVELVSPVVPLVPLVSPVAPVVPLAPVELVSPLPGDVTAPAATQTPPTLRQSAWLCADDKATPSFIHCPDPVVVVAVDSASAELTVSRPPLHPLPHANAVIKAAAMSATSLDFLSAISCYLPAVCRAGLGSV